MGNAIKKVANICTDRRQDANPTLDNAVHTGSGKPADPRGDPSAAGRKSGGGAVGGGASDARGGGAGDGGDSYGGHLSAVEQAAITMGASGGGRERTSLADLEKLLTFFEKRCKSGPRELPREMRLDEIMQRLAMDFWCELPSDALGSDLPVTSSGSVLDPVPRCKYLVWMGSGRPPLGPVNTSLRLEDGSLAFAACTLVRNNRNSTLKVMLRKTERRGSSSDPRGGDDRDSSRTRDVPTTYLRRVPGLVGDVIDETMAPSAPKKEEDVVEYEDGYTGVPDDYVCVSKVGQGAFSQVFQGRNTRTGEPVCLKVLRPTRPEKILREESLARALRGGPNIVLLLDALREPRTHTPCLVFENVVDLGWRRIRHADDIRHYTYELLRGIAYAHERSIFHRDLKPGNVLVDTSRNSVRIIDWGLADWYTPGKLYGSCGTPNFKPPEMLIDASRSSSEGGSSSRRRREYGLSVDVWSLGCMYGALLLGVYRLFNARSKQRSAQLLAVAKLLGVHDLRRWIDGTNCKLDTDSLAREGCPQHVTWSNCKGWDVARRIPEDGLDLLEGLMKWDPAERLTAEQAMRHPYFQAEWGAHAT